jgi:hypothetical protein
LHLLNLRDVQRVVGAVARDDQGGQRQAQRVERGQGHLQLRLVVAILAVAERKLPQFGERLDVGVGRGGIDADEPRVQVVDADGCAG